MTDRTKTPPETPAAKRDQAEHDKWLDEQMKQPGMIDMRGMTGQEQDAALVFAQKNRNASGVPTFNVQAKSCKACGHQHGGAEVAYICIGCPCEETPGKPAGYTHAQAMRTGTAAGEAHYHTFTFRDANRKLQAVPPDWYDGNPKRCPGSGLPPGVQYHGEVSEDGEPKYLCRCPWCDKPFRPGPMPEHTFVPVRAEDITFKTGKYFYGIEPSIALPEGVTMNVTVEPGVPQIAWDMLRTCDGNHADPPCASLICWRKEPPIMTVEARARRVGENIEILCGACELPLSSEGSLFVELEDEDQQNPYVWHVSCAMRHAAED